MAYLHLICFNFVNEDTRCLTQAKANDKDYCINVKICTLSCVSLAK